MSVPNIGKPRALPFSLSCQWPPTGLPASAGWLPPRRQPGAAPQAVQRPALAFITPLHPPSAYTTEELESSRIPGGILCIKGGPGAQPLAVTPPGQHRCALHSPFLVRPARAVCLPATAREDGEGHQPANCETLGAGQLLGEENSSLDCTQLSGKHIPSLQAVFFPVFCTL